MLKVAGAVIVCLAAWGYGCSLVRQLDRHRDQLFACGEMMELLMGEIRYGKTPFWDAFLRIAERMQEPFSSVLREISVEITKNQYESLEHIWVETFEKKKKELSFAPGEWEILKGVGKNLGYLDVQAQIQHLTLYRKQMQKCLEELEKGAKEKKRIYRSVSLMVGAMVVLILA